MASISILAIPAMSPAQELDFLVSPGPLHRAHSELSGLKNCSVCHSSEAGPTPDKCLSCHKELAERIGAQRGFHSRKANECFECHHEHQGEDFTLVRWDTSRFNHGETGYPLLGLHRKVEACDRCHHTGNSPPRKKTKTYFLNDTECVACHEDVHKNQLGRDCERCHALDVEFRHVSFDHRRTAFSLVGAHVRVECAKCHRDKQWKGIRFASCTDCHEDPHYTKLGSDCRRCHDSESWKVSTFDHERTRYPLRGMHRPVQCVNCHVNNTQFTGVGFATCVECHTKDPHAGQFTHDCSRCHVVEGFKQTTFDHAQSSYILTGQHTDVRCADCHRLETATFQSGVVQTVRYKPLPTTCTSCHKDIHLGQFAQGCDSCHITDGFSGKWVQFEHNEDSRFLLTGKHVAATCQDCHEQEQALFPAGEGTTIRYRPLPNECIDCHDNVHDRTWWRSAKNGGRSDCRACHSVDTFVVDYFDHDRTVFPLTGKHAGLNCVHCHDSVRRAEQQFLLFEKKPLDCVSCHRSPHLKGLERCTDCHTTTNWRVRIW